MNKMERVGTRMSPQYEIMCIHPNVIRQIVERNPVTRQNDLNKNESRMNQFKLKIMQIFNLSSNISPQWILNKNSLTQPMQQNKEFQQLNFEIYISTVIFIE
ncbi:Hypothetical_protein [Hexamita inflata]|uniref:Hypothetical_protein n=1 Tax=Hexamita inflata TaxID=28002 RepID=A0ABP1GUQ6_9EUKA